MQKNRLRASRGAVILLSGASDRPCRPLRQTGHYPQSTVVGISFPSCRVNLSRRSRTPPASAKRGFRRYVHARSPPARGPDSQSLERSCVLSRPRILFFPFLYLFLTLFSVQRLSRRKHDIAASLRVCFRRDRPTQRDPCTARHFPVCLPPLTGQGRGVLQEFPWQGHPRIAKGVRASFLNAGTRPTAIRALQAETHYCVIDEKEDRTGCAGCESLFLPSFDISRLQNLYPLRI